MTRSVPRIAAWPMYAVDPGAVATFWQVLRTELTRRGLADVPAGLSEPTDLASHWRDPALLLSQTCGYPFVTGLAGQVRYVATPRFRVPGCVGATYSSAVMVRDGDPVTNLAGLRGRRVAFNSRDSQSGYNSLRALVAPLAEGGRFFGSAVETGAHRRSLVAIRAGEADVAAIDAVTLALLAAAYPAELNGLRSIGHTTAAPGLPIITSAATADRDVTILREVLASACRPDTPAAAALRLDGIEVLPPDAYGVVLAMEAEAVANGYPDLC